MYMYLLSPPASTNFMFFSTYFFIIAECVCNWYVYYGQS